MVRLKPKNSMIGQVFLKKNLSYKIVMSERVGGRRQRLTFWLTFFQSYMLHLLLNCWTESNQIWFVASLHDWGVQELTDFWPAPQEPWGGVKRSNNNKIQLQSQF